MISIHLLGAPVVRRADGPITGRAAHRRRLALIAILAAARGRPVGRERLIGLLWPEHPGDAARHTLSESLYVLRKDLGEECFLVMGDEVGLDPAQVQCDLDEFERALDEGRWEDAVRAYAGPFLDGFYVSDAPEFERWVDGERDRLARGCGRALEELATAAEAAGAPLRAAEWWRRLLAHDAFSSRVALRLVRVLERAGERAAALRAAEAHVLLLRQELGVSPDAELVSLIEELRREPPPRPPRPEPPPPAAAVPAGDGVAEQGDPVPAAAAPPAGGGPPSAVPAESAPVLPSASRPAPDRWRRRRWTMGAAVGAGALGAVLAMVALAAGRDPAPPAEPVFDPRRIAVLYLDDDSPDGDLGYLASGLTEMLIHELSQVEALDVVSRNGVKPYRQGNVPFDSMVAALRVGSVVEGSVARSADSVRVVVQLIDASTHSHLESRVVVRPLGDLFAVERAVSEEVSDFLRRRLGAQVRLRQAAQETRSAEALDLALRGEQAFEDAQSLQMSRDPADAASARRMLGEADALLARAEAADPRWARPTVDRAWVAVQTALWTTGGAHEAAVDSAVARAGRVLAREPAHARALEVRGTAWRAAALAPGVEAEPLLERAERDLRAAVAAEPTLASAWGRLSLVLEMRGRLADANLAIERGLQHDAYLQDAAGLLHRRYFNALMGGDDRAALETCDRGRRYFPRDWRFVECRLLLLRRGASPTPDAALAWRLVAELEAMYPPAAAAAAGQAWAPISWRMAAAAVSARAGDDARARAEMARARVDAAVDQEAQVSLVFAEAYLLLLLDDRAGARERLDVYLALRPAERRMMARDPDPVVRELLDLTGRGSSPVTGRGPSARASAGSSDRGARSRSPVPPPAGP